MSWDIWNSETTKMRSRVVPMREMREKFRVEVKAFTPAFVIPRHAPGWEAMDSAEAQGLVFRPVTKSAEGGQVPAKRPVVIEVKRREEEPKTRS